MLRPVGGNGGADVRVHLVTPYSFNDAQEVADKFKQAVPVILNLQTTDAELAKRLIDFTSGLTYALEGGMQKIADKTFLLTPRNVEVSAEEKARLIEKGFFNQSWLVDRVRAERSSHPARSPHTLPMRVGFAGTGNMAAAMARGWAAGDGGPEAMLFCDLEADRARALAEEVGGQVARRAPGAGRRLGRAGARGQARRAR